MRACLVFAGLCGLFLPGAVWPGAVWADEPGAAESLIFARGGSLWRADSQGKGEPVEIVRTGQGAITRIEAARTTLLIESDEEVLWARPSGAAPVQAAALDCKPRAHLSPSGERVLCVDERGQVVLFVLGPSTMKVVLEPAISTHLGFVKENQRITSDQRGIWAVSLDSAQTRVLLSRERPAGSFLMAPSGKRAVGVFVEDDGESSALYSIRLDGKGVRRKLMKSAEPVAWSRDSRWIAVQHDRQACLVRAVGGEYKCWRNYRSVGIAPDGSYLLLVKATASDKKAADAHDLYKGLRDGVRPEPPTRLQRQVDGAGAWVSSSSSTQAP